MRPTGIVALASGAIGLSLLAGGASAQAQVISRQITTEPVETVVTQGPNGTVVTRRVMTPDPGVVAQYTAPPIQYSPVPPATVGQGTYQGTYQAAYPDTYPGTYVEPAPAAVVTRTLTTRRVATTRHARAAAHPSTSGLATRTVTRTVTQAADPLVLTPGQRQIIYRTIVQRQVYPQVYPPVAVAPPVVAQTEVLAPPAVVAPAVYPAAAAYADYDYGYYRRPYRWDGIALVPGVRLPPDIPLVGVPEAVASAVPGTAPLVYAYVDNRVYLVDPVTDIIVAEITP
jgi:hypothetical protein